MSNAARPLDNNAPAMIPMAWMLSLPGERAS